MLNYLILFLSFIIVLAGYISQQGVLVLPHPASRPAEPIPDVKYNQIVKQSGLTEQFKPNNILHNATILFKGKIQGSESVVINSNQFNESTKLYLLDKFGNIYVSSDQNNIEFLGYIGPGRPLGAHFDQHGNLIVCDSLKGLIEVQIQTMQIKILSNQAIDLQKKIRHVQYANDLDISSDGTIFFLSSTDIPPALNSKENFYDTLWSYLLTMFSGKPSGFLAKFDPQKKNEEEFQTQILMDKIWYANGVAISKNEDFVAVVETATGTIYKYFLKGPKKGKSEILIDGLPGFPDGIARDPDGTFWVAIIGKKFPIQLPKNKFVRVFIAHLWNIFRPPVKKFGGLLHIDENGKVLHFLTDEDGSNVYSVSGVVVGDEKIYMGCLTGDYVSYLDKSFLK